MAHVFCSDTCPSVHTRRLITSLHRILPPSTTVIQISQDCHTPRTLTITKDGSTAVFRIVDYAILRDAGTCADEIVTHCDDMLFWMQCMVPGRGRKRCCASLTRMDEFYTLMFYVYVMKGRTAMDVERGRTAMDIERGRNDMDVDMNVDIDVERVGPRLILRLIKDVRND